MSCSMKRARWESSWQWTVSGTAVVVRSVCISYSIPRAVPSWKPKNRKEKERERGRERVHRWTARTGLPEYHQHQAPPNQTNTVALQLLGVYGSDPAKAHRWKWNPEGTVNTGRQSSSPSTNSIHEGSWIYLSMQCLLLLKFDHQVFRFTQLSQCICLLIITLVAIQFLAWWL